MFDVERHCMRNSRVAIMQRAVEPTRGNGKCELAPAIGRRSQDTSRVSIYLYIREQMAIRVALIFKLEWDVKRTNISRSRMGRGERDVSARRQWASSAELHFACSTPFSTRSLNQLPFPFLQYQFQSPQLIVQW
jgi:hypothetical protein